MSDAIHSAPLPADVSGHPDIEEKGADTHLESQSMTDGEVQNTLKWSNLKAEADRDEEYQHSLTLWQSLTTYKAAALWSVVASFCIVMEG